MNWYLAYSSRIWAWGFINDDCFAIGKLRLRRG